MYRVSYTCHLYTMNTPPPLIYNSPRYRDDRSHGAPKPRERPSVSEVPLEGATAARVDTHLGDEGERLFLAVLEAPYQHQEVLLLVDQRLAETLRLEVATIEALKLNKNVFSEIITRLIHIKYVDLVDLM